MVETPSVEMFKIKLDGDLSDLTDLKMSLLAAGGGTRQPSGVPSNPVQPMTL